nr:histone-lysine N-methyltransferase, H3 lysine-9 specific SUVH6-like [Ipomoea batatas]
MRSPESRKPWKRSYDRFDDDNRYRPKFQPYFKRRRRVERFEKYRDRYASNSGIRERSGGRFTENYGSRSYHAPCREFRDGDGRLDSKEKSNDGVPLEHGADLGELKSSSLSRSWDRRASEGREKASVPREMSQQSRLCSWERRFSDGREKVSSSRDVSLQNVVSQKSKVEPKRSIDRVRDRLFENEVQIKRDRRLHENVLRRPANHKGDAFHAPRSRFDDSDRRLAVKAKSNDGAVSGILKSSSQLSVLPSRERRPFEGGKKVSFHQETSLQDVVSQKSHVEPRQLSGTGRDCSLENEVQIGRAMVGFKGRKVDDSGQDMTSEAKLDCVAENRIWLRQVSDLDTLRTSSQEDVSSSPIYASQSGTCVKQKFNVEQKPAIAVTCGSQKQACNVAHLVENAAHERAVALTKAPKNVARENSLKCHAPSGNLVSEKSNVLKNTSEENSSKCQRENRDLRQQDDDKMVTSLEENRKCKIAEEMDVIGLESSPAEQLSTQVTDCEAIPGNCGHQEQVGFQDLFGEKIIVVNTQGETKVSEQTCNNDEQHYFFYVADHGLADDRIQKLKQLKDDCIVLISDRFHVHDSRKRVMRTLDLFKDVYAVRFKAYKAEQNHGSAIQSTDVRTAMALKHEGKWVNYEGRVFVGNVPGVYIGDQFRFRAELVIVGLHRKFYDGIDYVKIQGKNYATSIVNSGRYDNRSISPDSFIYVGHGGNPRIAGNAPVDQKLKNGNLALKNSSDKGVPVRVTRACCVRDEHSTTKNNKRYIYEGLFVVTRYWKESSARHGKMEFMFELHRMPNQPSFTPEMSVRPRRVGTRFHRQALKMGRRPFGIIDKRTRGVFKTSLHCQAVERVVIDDVSQGKENLAIRVVSDIYAERPLPFTYTANMIYPQWYHPWVPLGCDCTNGCTDSKHCYCAFRNGGEIPYNTRGAIIKPKAVIHECGPACKCPPSCRNRVSQHGIRYHLEIFRKKASGWGVRSRDFISSGSFICEFVGELIDKNEAKQRIGHLQYFCPIANSEIIIDAACSGNVARFINRSSSSPNLYVQNVVYEDDYEVVPHIMLFACKNIPPMQEFTYDQSDANTLERMRSPMWKKPWKRSYDDHRRPKFQPSFKRQRVEGSKKFNSGIRERSGGRFTDAKTCRRSTHSYTAASALKRLNYYHAPCREFNDGDRRMDFKEKSDSVVAGGVPLRHGADLGRLKSSSQRSLSWERRASAGREKVSFPREMSQQWRERRPSAGRGEISQQSRERRPSEGWEKVSFPRESRERRPSAGREKVSFPREMRPSVGREKVSFPRKMSQQLRERRPSKGGKKVSFHQEISLQDVVKIPANHKGHAFIPAISEIKSQNSDKGKAYGSSGIATGLINSAASNNHKRRKVDDSGQEMTGSKVLKNTSDEYSSKCQREPSPVLNGDLRHQDDKKIVRSLEENRKSKIAEETDVIDFESSLADKVTTEQLSRQVTDCEAIPRNCGHHEQVGFQDLFSEKIIVVNTQEETRVLEQTFNNDEQRYFFYVADHGVADDRIQISKQLKDDCVVLISDRYHVHDSRRRVIKALDLFKDVYAVRFKAYKAEQTHGSPIQKIDVRTAMALKQEGKWVNYERVFVGNVPGVCIGDQFRFRAELVIVGLHRKFYAGIHYVKIQGKNYAISVVNSGRYDNQSISPNSFIYVGHGGNLSIAGKEPVDQELKYGNLALKNSRDKGVPVRVTRACRVQDENSTTKNNKRYIYEGLFVVTRYWQERSAQNCKMVFMFELHRMPNQTNFTPEMSVRPRRIGTWFHRQAFKEGRRPILNGKRTRGVFKAVERVVVGDVSQGKENLAIRVVSDIYVERPLPFTYTANMIYPHWYHPSVPLGCDCTNGCSDSKHCYCAFRNGGEIPYNTRGAITKPKPVIHECGPACKCPPSCRNRISQHGIRYHLEIFRKKPSGWGVRSRDYISSGSFICEFVGELLDKKEAEQRIGHLQYFFPIGNSEKDSCTAIAHSDEGSCTDIAHPAKDSSSQYKYGDGYIIDAACSGNVARFINRSSSSPNLKSNKKAEFRKMYRSGSTNRVWDDYMKYNSSSSPSQKVSSSIRALSLETNNEFPSYEPLSADVNKREKARTKLAENAVHLIPLVLFLCAFILWFLSNPDIEVPMSGDAIAARIEGLTIDGDVDSDGTQTGNLPLELGDLDLTRKDDASKTTRVV